MIGPIVPIHPIGACCRGVSVDRVLEWKPTPEEVAAILAELRPLIAGIARRQSEELARLTNTPR
jgi:hypothetical protein